MTHRYALLILGMIALIVLAPQAADARPGYSQTTDVSSPVGTLSSMQGIDTQRQQVRALVAQRAAIHQQDQAVQARQIDQAMASLFSGDLGAQDSEGRELTRIRAAGLEATVVPARSGDWRSQDAWAGFLVEASLSMPAKRHEQSIETGLATRLQPVAVAHGASPVRPLILPEPVIAERSQRPLPPRERLQRASFDIADLMPVAGPESASDRKDPEPLSASLLEMPEGQLRGSIFIDNDEDGTPTPGDSRLEGEAVTLTSVLNGATETHRSASFGAYVFEGVAPGHYLLSVEIGWERVELPVHVPGAGPIEPIEIALAPGLFEVDGPNSEPPRQYAMLE